MHLTADQLADFDRDGYVIARGILSPEEDLQPVMDEYAEILDREAERMFRDGEISSTYDELPFDRRTIAITREAGLLDPRPFDITIPINTASINSDTRYHFGPAVFALLRNERLLDAVESLIGPEITSNPVQHVRIKPPERYVTKNEGTGLVTTTGWHQDNGVVHEEADDTNMLTVWLPLTEATERNGCLMVVPGSYRDGLQVHCTMPNERGLNATTIPTQLIPKERAKPLPMSPGDVLLMHKGCMHASLTNHSDSVRWSFDLRYNPTGQSTGRTYFPAGWRAAARIQRRSCTTQRPGSSRGRTRCIGSWTARCRCAPTAGTTATSSAPDALHHWVKPLVGPAATCRTLKAEESRYGSCSCRKWLSP